MKRTLMVWTLLVALAGFLAAAAVPQSSAAEPGVTDTSIKIGSNMILTGSAAYWGQGSDNGARAYFNHINDLGGIHGRKIEFINSDNEFKPVRAVAAIKKLIERDNVFLLMGMQSSVCIVAAENVFGEAGVPLLAPITTARSLVEPPRDYLFVVFTMYRDQAKQVIDYLAKDPRGKDLKIGAIYQDDSFGKDGLEGMVEQAGKHPGMQVVIQEPFARGAKDFSSQVLKCKQSGVEALFLSAVTAETAMIMKEAEKLAWKPLCIVHSAAADDKLIELAGPAAEGALATTNVIIPSAEKGNPAMVEAAQIIHKYFPDQDINVPAIDGVAVAMITVEALKRAGKDLTRANVIGAAETMKHFETGLVPPVTFGPKIRQGCTDALIYRVEGGKFIRLK